MKTRTVLIAAAVAAASLTAAAADTAGIALPAPRAEGGKPLMEALKERRTIRSFSDKKLSMQTLSDLLWAAFGVNRPDGRRTAPSARNWQEIEIYVVLEEGAFLYDAAANTLRMIAGEDLRRMTGAQKFVAAAPLNLVYVADIAKMKGALRDDIALYSSSDAAFISQNVYLFCASEGLGTVVRGSVNRDACAKALKLPGDKKVILAQTVGYPAEEATKKR